MIYHSYDYLTIFTVMTRNTMENRKVLNCVIGRCSTQHTAGHLQELKQLPWKGNEFQQNSFWWGTEVAGSSQFGAPWKAPTHALLLGSHTLWAQKCSTGDKMKVEAQQMNSSCRTTVNAWSQLHFERRPSYQYILTAPARKAASHGFSVQGGRKILHKHPLLLLQAIQKPYIKILR